MNAQVMGTKSLWKYSWCTALASLGLMAWTSFAAAQVTISAGDVPNATAGQSAVVPITITLGSSVVNFFGASFTAAPQGSAPAIASKLLYAAVDPLPAPDIVNNTHTIGVVAISYLTNLSPALTGTVHMADITVPIPAGAGGTTYQLQVSKISGGFESCSNATTTVCASDADCPDQVAGSCSVLNPVTFTGQPGTITVGGVAAPTSTPTQVVAATSTPTQVVAATSTPTTKPAATATATKAGGTTTPTTAAPACPSCEDDDGCQIGARGHSGAWLLLIPAIGLLVVRRRRR